jgi:hypothetical protein
MKHASRCILMILGVLLLSAVYTSVFADAPQPPPLPGEHGGGGNVAAPIDGGLSLLLAFGLAYGGKKFYRSRKSNRKELQGEE